MYMADEEGGEGPEGYMGEEDEEDSDDDMTPEVRLVYCAVLCCSVLSLTAIAVSALHTAAGTPAAMSTLQPPVPHGAA